MILSCPSSPPPPAADADVVDSMTRTFFAEIDRLIVLFYFVSFCSMLNWLNMNGTGRCDVMPCLGLARSVLECASSCEMYRSY